MKNRGVSVSYKKHVLQFKFDAGTSRGVLRTKAIYYILIKDNESKAIVGLGEAAPLKGLSIDDRSDFEKVTQQYCLQVEQGLALGKSPTTILDAVDKQFPALKLGFEMALRDMENGGRRVYFESNLVDDQLAIPINGLIWMNNKEHMLSQVKEKIAAGFHCIKMKIGAIDFEQECAILAHIRKQYGPQDIMLRVDANGAFQPAEAREKLEQLSKYKLHSIEQPIQAGNTKVMRQLCEESPLSIALDEELIGVFGLERKEAMLRAIKPQYIILKPTLLGGFEATDEWIQLANKMGIGWWITSALESNVGLGAIAQYTAQLPFKSYQGLGTGSLFHNNIPSPLTIIGGELHYKKHVPWDLTLLNQ